MVVGIYCFFIDQKKIIGSLFIILAVCTHLGILLAGLIALPYYLFLSFKQYNRSTLLICIVLSLFLGKTFIYTTLKIFFPEWDVVDVYAAEDAYWNKGYLEYFSIKNYLMKFILLPSPIYIWATYCFLHWEDKIMVPRRLFFASCLIYVFLFDYPNLFNRFSLIVMIFALYDFMHNACKKNLKNSILQAVLVFAILYAMISYVNLRKNRDYSREILFPFTPGVTSLFMHYDDQYVNQNISDDGNHL